MQTLALTFFSSQRAWPVQQAMALAFTAAAISTSVAYAAQPALAAPLTPAPQLAARQAWDSALTTGRCATTRDWQALRRSLHLLHLQLQAQGLQLRVLQCPPPHTLPTSAVWVQVGVWVHDSAVAERFVRGPLAEGELLDMAADHPPAHGAQALAVPEAGSAADTHALGQGVGDDAAADVSPDVHFNRQWLARTMATQGFAPVPGQWWTFAWDKRLHR